MSVTISLVLSNSPKPIGIQITIMYDKEKYQILTTEKLEPSNIWHLCLKHDQSDYSIVKIVISRVKTKIPTFPFVPLIPLIFFNIQEQLNKQQ